MHAVRCRGRFPVRQRAPDTRESPSAVGMGVRILATPVTVAADGVLVPRGIVLVPIAVVAIKANGGRRIM
ncbi:hypothetical protein DIE06_30045 [Burkholderia sp. Bp8998]|nr:hypothetical protein DIE06_30045 [Burkholderia sp. Bp8998]